MSGVKRYDFFAYMDDEVAELDCHEADDGGWILASDYDALAVELQALNDEIIDHRNYTKACRDRDEAQKARVAELESLARIFQTWLGASRDQCDESGQRLWDRIEATLADQQQSGERVLTSTNRIDSMSDFKLGDLDDLIGGVVSNE